MVSLNADAGIVATAVEPDDAAAAWSWPAATFVDEQAVSVAASTRPASGEQRRSRRRRPPVACGCGGSVMVVSPCVATVSTVRPGVIGPATPRQRCDRTWTPSHGTTAAPVGPSVRSRRPRSGSVVARAHPVQGGDLVPVDVDELPVGLDRDPPFWTQHAPAVGPPLGRPRSPGLEQRLDPDQGRAPVADGQLHRRPGGVGHARWPR